MLSEFVKITGVKLPDLLGKTRNADVVAARHVYWLLLRCSGLEFKQIARIVNRKYPAIIQGIQSVKGLLTVNDKKVVDIYNKTKHLIKTDMSKIKSFIELHVPQNKDSMKATFADTKECGCCNGKGYIYYGGYNEKFKENIDDPDEKPCPCCYGSGKLECEITINWKPQIKF